MADGVRGSEAHAAVRFADEADVVTLADGLARRSHGDAEGEGPREGDEVLGFGHARMNAAQLEDWARAGLSEASAPRVTEGFAAQDELWAKEANVDGRGHWSVREAVRLYAHRFQEAVGEFEVCRMLAAATLQPRSALAGMPGSVLAQAVDALYGQAPTVDWINSWARRPNRAGSTMRVTVRKRPILPFEEERSEWDCVEADARRASFICHDGRLARNGKRLDLWHRRSLLDQVWDESASNETVAREAALPLLSWAQRGHGATMLCYGQTGTGKTHTMSGVLDLLADELGSATSRIEAQYFEVCGDKLHDLLNDRAEVQLMADAEGRFHLRGAATVQMGAAFGGAEGIRESVGKALRLRASEATERNPLSSRSHAVLVLWLRDSGGMLRLVDLAGSERNYETEKMTAAQHRESALINRSLMALKDCFRAHAALNRGERARPPFRASRLTQCLRDCFEEVNHRFLLIATVSPASSDVIHTANTLKHAVMMAGPLEAVQTELKLSLPLGSGVVSSRNVPVAQWTTAEVQEWVATVERGRFAQLVLPPQIDGAGLLALSSQRLATMFEGTMRAARGEGEGLAWNLTGYEDGQGSGVKLGRALFAAVRREALAALGRARAAEVALGESMLSVP
eukprot:TRINITY_DN10732_c0_g1_i1.p1 TRINITY_DN10732_c0_g1~~TRINITY_DN10732_c0_g1_i1.p1  ORF type:complete len:629 (-),score=115.48 TRINITY_DN10732_c0_g1_i1:467-2353(-)